MGGYHYYKDGEPQHPLSRWDVIKLVKSGGLVPPTDEELRNWSQNDALSKTLAVVQTLWFVVQAIARGLEGLPITQLEILTLAYTTITVAMYIAWWDKPQNVGGPFRVAVKTLPEPAWVLEHRMRYLHIFDVIAGWQDHLVDLRKERRVPTFYGGTTYLSENSFHADVIALCVAMVFGAVHCAAWHYAFPSTAEKIFWRICSLATVIVPGAMLIPILLGLVDGVPDILLEVLPFTFAASAPIYVTARILLLVISFTTLRSLPSEAYSAVQWTLRIPHFT
ncbi:hypothetical protein BV25DRAFT_1828593 [Artomyces pyxidatus]|uniref:Uncharacterized protein n=1 Tax=Artomyces pyxidatus TaxID=48021 RepID=A0ACB8SU28_9AGAM|nr:hypothetical protein BV25DRAFT_1828593 [Artomyces pyxidatus]